MRMAAAAVPLIGVLGAGLAHCRDGVSSNGFQEHSPRFGIVFADVVNNERGMDGNRLIYAVDGSDMNPDLSDDSLRTAILHLLSAQATYETKRPMQCTERPVEGSKVRAQQLSCLSAVSPLSAPTVPLVQEPSLPRWADPSCGDLRTQVLAGVGGKYAERPPEAFLSGPTLSHFQAHFNAGANVLLGNCLSGFSSWER